MSLRALTKCGSHYLVQYVCDKKYQVRTKNFFRVNDETIVSTCDIYTSYETTSFKSISHIFNTIIPNIFHLTL